MHGKTIPFRARKLGAVVCYSFRPAVGEIHTITLAASSVWAGLGAVARALERYAE
mgnify:CR=1 FL=1